MSRTKRFKRENDSKNDISQLESKVKKAKNKNEKAKKRKKNVKLILEQLKEQSTEPFSESDASEPPSDLDGSEQVEQYNVVKNNADESDDEILSNNISKESEKKTTRRRNKIRVDDPTKVARTIFVGNVPILMTVKKLKKVFKEFGEIESIRFRGVTPSKPTIAPKVAAIKKGQLSKNSRDSSIAYIVFKEEADCEKALSMNGHVLDGHHLRVDKCNNEQTNYLPSLSVFVGNLPSKVKEDDLWKVFEDRKIKAIRIVRDRETGLGKGIAFVMFQSKDDVAFALENNEVELNGRKLRIQRLKSKTGERSFKSSKFTRNFDSNRANFTKKSKIPSLKKKRKIRKTLAKKQQITELLNK